MGSMTHIVLLAKSDGLAGMGMMRLTMSASYEITGKYAAQYAKASKKRRGEILDEVVSVTGWSHDNARRRL